MFVLLGLIQTKQERNTYPSVRKTLKLIVDDVDESNPSDLSYGTPFIILYYGHTDTVTLAHSLTLRLTHLLSNLTK